ncbi:MAG TPA: hypothetical protein VIL99_13735 [Ignavibacteria bacterium]
MSKIIFEINYNVFPEKREEYLQIVEELKTRIRENTSSDYFVLENKKLTNNFSELYIFDSREDFDNMEDNQDEATSELIEKIFDEFIVNKKVNYTTKEEV